MVETPTDLDLNKGKDIHIDSANDLATTSGQAQIQQSVGLDVMEVTQNFVGESVDGETIGRLEEAIRESLDGDEQVLSVRRVDISEYNQATDTVTAEIVVVDDPNFTIDVIL